MKGNLRMFRIDVKTGTYFLHASYAQKNKGLY